MSATARTLIAKQQLHELSFIVKPFVNGLIRRAQDAVALLCSP
jgi:hypothetical protein